MDGDVVAWAFGGYVLIFCTAFAAGLIHKAIIKLAEGAAAG